MIYLLDTDALICLVRGLKSGRHRPTIRQQAAAIMAKCRETMLAGDLVGLSAVTVSELEFGARNSTAYETEIAALRKVLTPFEVYDFDAVHCPPQYGRIRHALETQGQSIGALDLLIAAHALALDATLVTNNESHFRRVPGLRVVNWTHAN